ncbi:MAG: KpsF/GutQ family sugar-phosphate isomerase [Opitutales bacterium]|jgi:arabinose-5-phosphate isomerase
MTLSSEEILSSARNCLRIEQEALQITSDNLGDSFINAIRLIEKAILAGNKLVFTGVGKNVPICMKLFGTFNSTGVPAAYLDPNQALHGDLGLCLEGDLCLLFSNSGETEDLLRLIPALKRLGVTTLAITPVGDSSLAKFCDHRLLYHYNMEACPLNLAPTSSTTAALALGDALAMVYLEMRGFSREDFARYHPAGSLGKVLLLKVEEIMRSGDKFAKAPDTINVKEALLAITNARCGTIALYDESTQALTGVFSDGDFRRGSLKTPDILSRPVSEFMTRNPKTIASGALAVDALKIFGASSINDLLVVDADNHPIGVIDGQDMPKLKIV